MIVRFMVILGEEIVATGSCEHRRLSDQSHGSAEEIRTIEPGLDVCSSRHWWDGAQPVAKTTMDCVVNKESIASDGLDELVILGVPAGSTAMVLDGQGADLVEINDGEIRVTSNAPEDRIRVEIKHSRHFPMHFFADVI